MKKLIPVSLVLLTLLPATLFADKKSGVAPTKHGGCACCIGQETCCCQVEQPAPKRYPLTGVIREVYPERGALMVKHEAIPDYMPAMTMLFKVEATVLPRLKKGDAITGTLFRRGEDFWLENIRLAAP